MDKYDDTRYTIAAADDYSITASTDESKGSRTASDCPIPLTVANARAVSKSTSWSTTLLRFGPLSGILCIGLAAASLIASLGILKGSDGARVDNWSAQPSAYLAAFTAIANISMRYAAFQGAVIWWWVRALRGTTLAGLHQAWMAGTSVRGAFLSGHRMGLIGIACILSTLVAVDGPLLQRASKVQPLQDGRPVLINVTMTPELPNGFSGYWSTAAEAGHPGYHIHSMFNSTIPTVHGTQRNNIVPNLRESLTFIGEEWTNSNAISGIVQGCPGTCKAQIRAPCLFPSACETHTIRASPFIDYNYIAATEGIQAPPLEALGFAISPGLLVGEHEAINLITGAANFTPSKSCSGEFVYKVCTLEPAIGEYEVSIQDDKILMASLATPTLVALANNTAINYTSSNHGFSKGQTGYESTLAGVANYALTSIESFISYYAHNSTAESALSSLVLSMPLVEKFQNYNSPQCPPNYTDPHDFSLQNLNKLMLYMGAAATLTQDPSYLESRIDPGLSLKNTVTGYESENYNIYRTTYRWFAAAAIIDVVTILCILPTYWGWWKMGRSVSFSPLEIGNAFGAPMLAQYNSNSTGPELAAQTRGTRVKYGQVAGEGGTSKLEFGDPSVSVTPRNHITIDA